MFDPGPALRIAVERCSLERLGDAGSVREELHVFGFLLGRIGHSGDGSPAHLHEWAITGEGGARPRYRCCNAVLANRLRGCGNCEKQK